jgi:hypothetical protein
MKSLINIKRITRFSYIFGIACLLAGIMFSFASPPGVAATVNGNGSCDTGAVNKDESAPFEYKGSETIVKAIVKAGQGCFALTINKPNDGCYKADGLGTSSVKVSRIGEASSSCQEISHVEFFAGQVETPETPTEPPPTEVTPTEPTPTDPTPTDPTPTDPTPTDPTPTEPTPTDPTPTEPTPTEPTPTEPTFTDPTPTEPKPTDPTPTEPTPTDSPETVTPTDPPEKATPTDPPKPKTPTPPPTLSQPTPMKTDSPPILIPVTGVDLSASNQIFGTRFFLFLGLTFIGIGMIFHGVSNRRTRNEPQEK